MNTLFDDSFGDFFSAPLPPAAKLPMQEMVPQRVVVPPRNIDVIIGGQG